MTSKEQLLRVIVVITLAAGLAACSSGGTTPASSQPVASVTTKAAAPASTAGKAAATSAASSATGAAKAATGPGDDAAVTFAEFSLAGSNSARAGKVTFKVSNSGMLPHNLNIVKSDVALDKLPQKEGQVDLSALQVVIKTADILEGGEDVTVSGNFAPGKYIMFCNVIGHYQLGMAKQLTVN